MKEETKLHVQEDEKDILLGHVYDGIQELNHPLPSWWAFLFYAFIVYGIAHFVYFVFLGGPSLRDEFKKEYAVVVAHQEEFKKLEGEFNPETYAQYTTPEQIKKGAEVFENNCVACHMEKGYGDIGPNLTDEYWLWAKGTPETVYPIVFNGVVDNGMPNWAEVLSKEEIYQVVAYVQTLHMTKHPKGKAPQGDKVE